jgi:hypothetical protein
MGAVCAAGNNGARRRGTGYVGGILASVILAPIDRLLYATHDMHWNHVERWLAIPERERGPILVERLPGGWLFVHDGRHRVEAAWDDGVDTVCAIEV